MIRTLLLFLLLLIVVGLVALGWSFRAAVLPVEDAFAVDVPEASPPAGMRLSVLHAGRMASVAAMAYRGGGFTDERAFGMDPVLIEHPRGDLLIDSGFGRDVEQHFRTTPKLMQWTADYEEEITVADRFADAGREPDSLHAVLLTHAHWDHVSGLADLPGVPVWLPRDELDFVQSGHPSARLAASLGGVEWHSYAFEDGPYLGFERSLDFHGDGSVVVVPAGGHTPGSVIIFVTLPDGVRYAFIGDLTWQAEGVDLPAERPWVSRQLVDVDAQRVREQLVRLHQLQEVMPELQIVPAHDRGVARTLPEFDARS